MSKAVCDVESFRVMADDAISFDDEQFLKKYIYFGFSSFFVACALEPIGMKID